MNENNKINGTKIRKQATGEWMENEKYDIVQKCVQAMVWFVANAVQGEK